MEKRDLIGKLCPYCKSQFLPDDNVVLCSECDMPHHRDCWIENKCCTTFGCTGTIKGLDGATVAPEEINVGTAVPQQNMASFCTKCGAPIAQGNAFCTKCGNPVSAQRAQSYTPPTQNWTYGTGAYGGNQGYNNAYQTGQSYAGTYGQQTELDPNVVRMIGQKEEYYVSKFLEMKKEDKKTSWNWPAFLITPYWLIYRKMYAYGGAVLAANLLLSLIGGALCSLLSLAIDVVAGIYGNYIYMDYLEKQSQQAKTMTEAERAPFINGKSGVNTAAAVISAIAYGILVQLLL